MQNCMPTKSTKIILFSPYVAYALEIHLRATQIRELIFTGRNAAALLALKNVSAREGTPALRKEKKCRKPEKSNVYIPLLRPRCLRLKYLTVISTSLTWQLKLTFCSRLPP